MYFACVSISLHACTHAHAYALHAHTCAYARPHARAPLGGHGRPPPGVRIAKDIPSLQKNTFLGVHYLAVAGSWHDSCNSST